jgi:hypothetical protein
MNNGEKTTNDEQVTIIHCSLFIICCKGDMQTWDHRLEWKMENGEWRMENTRPD